jgi:hypothetical protein
LEYLGLLAYNCEQVAAVKKEDEPPPSMEDGKALVMAIAASEV